MSNKNDKSEASEGETLKEEKQKLFVGKVTRPFTIQGKTDNNKKVIREKKEYKLGDKFETTNENIFNGLIAKKRIKR